MRCKRRQPHARRVFQSFTDLRVHVNSPRELAASSKVSYLRVHVNSPRLVHGATYVIRAVPFPRVIFADSTDAARRKLLPGTLLARTTCLPHNEIGYHSHRWRLCVSLVMRGLSGNPTTSSRFSFFVFFLSRFTSLPPPLRMVYTVSLRLSNKAPSVAWLTQAISPP